MLHRVSDDLLEYASAHLVFVLDHRRADDYVDDSGPVDDDACHHDVSLCHLSGVCVYYCPVRERMHPGTIDIDIE